MFKVIFLFPSHKCELRSKLLRFSENVTYLFALISNKWMCFLSSLAHLINFLIYCDHKNASVNARFQITIEAYL